MEEAVSNSSRSYRKCASLPSGKVFVKPAARAKYIRKENTMLFIIIFAFIFIIFLIAIFSRSDSQTGNSANSYSYSEPSFSLPAASDRKPKISAEVDEDFYKSVRSYCSGHSITISDLVRKSVKSYIDNN